MSDLLRVLYAEDEADIRRLTEVILDDEEGFELTACVSGQEAVDKAATMTPDLILLDVMMPGIDGLATLKKLREYPHLANTPVIFMTAKVQANEMSEYQSLGVLGVINKPFDPMRLADDIRNLYGSHND